jgi:uncharacterized membrane protein YcaP (DUF421 family)
MNEQKTIEVFDWHRIFVSEEVSLDYLPEIVFRTFVMFLVLIFALKFLSKRGVKQLSVFELAILIALGSAIGDPMFYNHIPITYGIVVLAVVISLYKGITSLTAKYKITEEILEGKPVCLLIDGRIEYETYKKIGLPYDKFFAELRGQSIDHLGQVRRAYLETSGEISVYFFGDSEVIEGLPIFPEVVNAPRSTIDSSARHACIHCGNIQQIDHPKSTCLICHNSKWVSPDSRARVQ